MFDDGVLEQLRKSLRTADTLQDKIKKLRTGIMDANNVYMLCFCFDPNGRFDIYVQDAPKTSQRSVCWANDILGDLRNEIRAAFIAIAERRLRELEAEFEAMDKIFAKAVGARVPPPAGTEVQVELQGEWELVMDDLPDATGLPPVDPSPAGPAGA